MKENSNIIIPTKKSTLYTLELETYLANVQQKADKISDRFVSVFFLLGLLLAFVYETWIFTFVNSVIIAALYLIARFVLTNKFHARMIISLVYAIFMLQFIGQMHGMAEMHFFFFINVALLIIYQDWRIMIPYTVLGILHHSVLGILQANPDIFHLENINLSNYFIGYNSITFNGETVNGITTFQLLFHFSLISTMAFIAGYWAVIFRKNSIQLLEKQLEQQAQNEELQSSEEELRQNTEELQSTNDQMQGIQKEIEEKQNLLNRAERLVGMASYEVDLTTQKLTHSENLPFISGEEKLDNVQRVIEIAHPEDAHKVVEALTLAAKGEIQNYDISYRAKGEKFTEYKYYRTVGELINDEQNQPEKIVGTIQDITEQIIQKQKIEEAYQEIQASEEEIRQNYEELQTTQEELNLQKGRLEQIFDGVPAMVYQFKMTKDGQLSFPIVSKGSERVYGLSPEVIKNDANSILSTIYEEDLEVFQASLLESAQNMTEWQADLRVIVDGKTQWIRGNSKPVKDDDGDIIWSGITQEITAQKQLEQDIQAKNEELQSSEEELRQNTEELQSTNDQMQVIQKEIEEKQMLLNRAEKIVSLASYEVNLTTQGLIHSDNLPIIYGEESVDEMSKILEIIHLEDRHIVSETLGKASKGEIESYDILYRAKGKKLSEYRYYKSAGELVRNEMNNPEKLVGTTQDITNEIIQKQKIEEAYQEIQASEEELRQNTEELQSTNDQLQVIQKKIEEKQDLLNKAEKLVGMASYEIDLATQKITASDNLSLIYGEDILNNMQEITQIAHPEDVHTVVETLTQAAQGKIQVYDFLYRSKGQNFSEYKYYRAVGELIKDETGNPQKLVGTSQDITNEIKQKYQVEEAYQKIQSSEEELRQNYEELQATQESLVATQVEQEKFVSLIKHFDAFVAITDMEGKIQFLNERGKELSGFGEDYKGRLISEFHTGEYAKIAQEVIIPTVLKKGKWQGEHQLQNQETKKAFETLATVFIIKDPHTKESIALATVQIDITEQKKIEKSIQEQNKKLQASEEELQQNYEELQTTQEQLQKQKNEVESSLLELQTTQSQLIQSEKMASLGQLVANIAHEINTPLGAIRSSAISIEEILEETLPSLPAFLRDLDDVFLEVFNEFVKEASLKTDTLSSREKRAIKYDLIDELEAINIDEAEEYADWIVDMNMYEKRDLFFPLLEANNAKDIFHIAYQLSTIIRSNRTVKTATDRAAKIVFALKNFARQDQTGEKAMVNINESIETTLTLYHNQIKHGIDVTRSLGEVPEFMGYPDELIQVWTNIIHNAIQAMENNGGLFIKTSVENNNVMVSIQDTGGGIPKEVQERVFDAFFTTKAAGEGSGLGLDITKKIIDKHDGKIWFETSEGVGTTFFIQIPLNKN